MAFQACDFIYDGVPSEKYNLKIGYFTEGVIDYSSGANVEIIEDKVRRNPVPYFYGTEITPPLSFEMTIFSEEELDSYDRQAINQWLFGRQEYKYLQIDQKDLEGTFFKCLLLDPKTTYIGNVAYAQKFTVRCNAPWGWSDEKNDTYSLTSSPTSINYINFSDNDQYLYPDVSFTTDISTTSFSITNNSDNGRIFSFTGISGSETINVTGGKIITSSTSNNRLNNFNLKWFRLTTGLNQLSVSGKGSLTITSRFPMKVGG